MIAKQVCHYAVRRSRNWFIQAVYRRKRMGMQKILCWKISRWKKGRTDTGESRNLFWEW